MKNFSRNSNLATFLLIALVSSSACAQSSAPAAVTSGPVSADLQAISVPAAMRTSLNKLYAERGFQPAFVQNGFFTSLVSELKNTILAVAPAHGLSADYYWTAKLEALSLTPGGQVPPSAEFEFAKAYVDLATHISTGRLVPTSISPDIKYSRQSFTAFNILNAGLVNQGLRYALENVAPQHDKYKKLVSALARLRAIEAAGGFKPIYAPKSTLRVGSSSPIVAQIKTRAQQMGHYVSVIDNNYDYELSEIIRKIQASNLAPVTGNMSPSDSNTWEWFSISSARRIQQVEMNLEKLRWLPKTLEPRHLFINLATQKLNLNDSSNYNPLLNDMRVINGRAERKTPSMRDETSHVVLNPQWGVPPTVFAEDKVPALREEILTRGYWGVDDWFAKGRYTVMDSEFKNQLSPHSIDWVNLNPKTADFYIVQKPGYDNALGVVKIMLKNPWQIYLHDTNQRELFANSARALSSGCIRMDKPMDMAEYMLRGTTWTREKLNAFVPSMPGETKDKESWIKIPDANKVAVYTMSLTAQVGDDNVISFTRDVYRQNAAILAALQAGGYVK